jgi:hypothetical protein
MTACNQEIKSGKSDYSLEVNLEVDEEKVCDDAVNFHDCYRRKEAVYAAQYPDLIERDGQRLSLKMDNGKWVDFEDVTPEREVEVSLYALSSFQINPGLYCVYNSLWEGGVFEVVMKKNGNRYKVLGEPILAESYKRFVCFNTDFEANYDPTGIQIWSIGHDKCTMEYEIKDGRNVKGEYWGAKEVEWVSDKRIKISRVTYDPETFAETDDGVMLLSLQNQKWIEL